MNYEKYTSHIAEVLVKLKELREIQENLLITVSEMDLENFEDLDRTHEELYDQIQNEIDELWILQ